MHITWLEWVKEWGTSIMAFIIEFDTRLPNHGTSDSQLRQTLHYLISEKLKTHSQKLKRIAIEIPFVNSLPGYPLGSGEIVRN